MKSPLARYAPIGREPDPEGVRKLAREVRRDTDENILIFDRRWFGWAQRKQLDLLAEQAGIKPKGA